MSSKLILNFLLSEEFGGHGNSFFGVGGRGSKRAQLRFCIRLLRSVCNAGNEDILQDLTDQGLISQIVGRNCFSKRINSKPKH